MRPKTCVGKFLSAKDSTSGQENAWTCQVKYGEGFGEVKRQKERPLPLQLNAVKGNLLGSRKPSIFDLRNLAQTTPRPRFTPCTNFQQHLSTTPSAPSKRRTHGSHIDRCVSRSRSPRGQPDKLTEHYPVTPNDILDWHVTVNRRLIANFCINRELLDSTGVKLHWRTKSLDCWISAICGPFHKSRTDPESSQRALHADSVKRTLRRKPYVFSRRAFSGSSALQTKDRRHHQRPGGPDACR